jgi:hypothetical protein
MDTLVNRLRGIYSVGPGAAYGVRSFADFISPIRLEAANRIDELEDKVKNLEFMVENGLGYEDLQRDA